MTNEELQTVVAAVIQALKTNGKTIAQLTPVTSLANSDSLEVSGGKKIAFSKLKELVASAVVVTEESIKGWVVIDSTSELPEDPTGAQQEKAYVLADDSTLYVYVGEGGDTLDGKYQSVDLKGPQGEPGADGHDGVDLGEVALINDLTTGGEGAALSAEMGKTLKGLIDSKTFPIVNDLTTGGTTSALSAEMGKTLKAMIDGMSMMHGTFLEALEAALEADGVFVFLLMDEVNNDDFVKPIWFTGGTYIDAAGAAVSLATLNDPVFSRDSGDVYAGTTVTITCPSGSTLYYSVNGVSATSTTDVTVTINAASVLKAFVKNGDAVSDIVAKTYGIAIDHRFQFKIKLTGNNSTEYVPVIASGAPKYTMTVDWGDGSTPSEYSNQGFSAKGCYHAYTGSAGDEFTITLRGSAIPYLAFASSSCCNIGALVAILDNTLECTTNFSNANTAGSLGFKDCTNLESMSANALSNSNTANISFRGCTKLTSVPTGFFANLHNLTSAYGMFYDSVLVFTNDNLDELKVAIKNATDLSYLFYSFDGTLAIPDDFFDEVTATVASVANMFNSVTSSNVSGDAKALYDVLVTKVGSGATTSNCFSSTRLSNRNQVPSAWGGTGS